MSVPANQINPTTTPPVLTSGSIDPSMLSQYMSQYNTANTPGGAAQGTSNYQNSPAYNMQFGAGAQQMWNSSPVSTMTSAPQQVSNVANQSQPNLSLNDYLNSDAYKVQYGTSAAAQSTDPNVRFQNDPGIQAAIAAGMPSIANSYGAKGLGASGTAADAVAQYMYNNYTGFTQNQANLYNTGLQNVTANQTANTGINQFNAGVQQNNINNQQAYQQQQVNNYTGQQNLLGNSFNTYQNQLAGLANNGASSSMANMSNTNSQQLASLLAQLQSQTGTSMSNNGLGVSQNISQLLANNGVLQSGLLMNTGAAMSNNQLQGSLLGAQLANVQNQSNAQTASSGLGGLGAMYGMQQRTNGGYM